MTRLETRERVRKVVVDHDGPVTSKLISSELAMSRNWACQMLADLVEHGVITVANAEGGTYEWSAP